MPDYLDGRVTVYGGDALEVLRTLPDESFHACVCDPPYALVSIARRFGADDAAPVKSNGATGVYVRAAAGFMGQRWDNGSLAFNPEFWREVLRVLKPGGHIVAFGGCRTYHRLVCAIEDAGAEVRDQVAWLFATGFPKNHSVNRSPMFCQCDAIAHNGDDRVHEHLHDDRSDMAAGDSDDGLLAGDVRHSTNREQDFPDDCLPDRDLCDGQLLLSEEGDRAPFPLSRHALAHSHVSGHDDETDLGSSHNLSPARYSDRLANRDCSPLESSASVEQGCIPSSMSRAHASLSDGDRQGSSLNPSWQKHATGFPRCQRCGKPNANGFGSSLKPAHEPVCIARKPLVGTIAENVARYGTGAINVDGCRIETSENLNGGTYSGELRDPGPQRCLENQNRKRGIGEYRQPVGRWPANVCHDGSPEVLAAFPDAPGAQRSVGPEFETPRSLIHETGYGPRTEMAPRGDDGSAARFYAAFPNGRDGEASAERRYTQEGATNFAMKPGTRRSTEESAARFFFSSKADEDQRAGSSHPTVKPVGLMRWLCRLVCPPGGLILDPFAGTGTTGEAAYREGFSAVLIEREAAYLEDIARRMALVRAGPVERSHVIVKARGKAEDDPGPLFSGLSE